MFRMRAAQSTYPVAPKEEGREKRVVNSQQSTVNSQQPTVISATCQLVARVNLPYTMLNFVGFIVVMRFF
jgi:hypothetical protein